jgi:catechol 2,3-dioxygenase-like lactoylglutathione lyase family enzyme
MGFHHVAIATRDVKATHAFYTGAMGFALAKVEIAPAGKAGWAKHLFYDTGDGEMIAFWDFHDAELPPEWSPAISDGLGLPHWANHIAFDARDRADLDARRGRWLEHGCDVMEVDHVWCVSIYTNDPNGVMVEFCTTTRPLGAADRAEALRLLAVTTAELPDAAPAIRLFRASEWKRGPVF